MAKLLPPIVEGTIPAFYSSNDGTVKITVPFIMNRAVSFMDVKNIKLKIKTLQSSTVLGGTAYDATAFNLSNDCYANFSIPDNIFELKQFYKFQIAYVGIDDIVGNYSSVAIGKYTAQPNVYIDNLNLGLINYHTHSYTGVYETEDNTENLHSYQFILTDDRNEIYFTTGELIHNALNDEDLLKSIDTCIISQDLDDRIYYLQYKIKTLNGIEAESEKYILAKSLNIDMDVKKPKLIAVANSDEGCISLTFVSDSIENSSIDANFTIYRSDEDSNYLNWQECYYFSLNDSTVNCKDFWQDYTIEHEKKYKYAIAQFNNKGLYSNKIIANIDPLNNQSTPVFVSFDDIFLYDGLYNMKIKFNPKVSSFKNNNSESKIETIGSQYPFILRNGFTSYKEFPISGLITHLMDSSYQKSTLYRTSTGFSSYENFTDTLSTNLTSQNIYKERTYKLDMLSWLTNGRPKLFRSPTEGNYLVRLLNVSLSPLDQLGRMLHSFTCTAYEVAECNYENMNAFNITGLNNIKIVSNTLWNTIDLKTIIPNENILENITATTLRFYDMIPGQEIKVEFADREDLIIVIGQTGMYRLEYNKYKIIGVKILPTFNQPLQGYMTYSFDTIIDNNFKEYDDIEIISIPAQQFIGKTNIIDSILKVQNNISNSKLAIVSIPRIKCEKRPTFVVRQSGSKYYYFDGIREVEWNLRDANEYTLYVIVEKNNNDYRVVDFRTLRNNSLSSIVPNNVDLQTFEKNLFNIYLGESVISLQENYDFNYDSSDLSLLYNKNNELKFNINDGIIAEISYNLKSQTYILESNIQYLIKNKKEKYQLNKNALEDIYQGKQVDIYLLDGTVETIPSYNINSTNLIEQKTWWNNIKRLRKLIDESYEDYIVTLEDEKERQKIIEGFVDGG